MRKVYLYLLNTMADWETGYISAELHSRRFFKKDAEEIIFKHAAVSKESIKTMGGLSVVPDCTIDEISADENTVLILPGADSWNETKNEAISYTITEDQHTQTGAKIWIVKPDTQLSKTDFAEVKRKFATIQGYYSTFKNGFIFKYNPTEALQTG